MPRRKSLLAQMYEARQKAKLQQQKLEEQAVRAWAAEERRVAAQAEKEAAQLRREEERAAQARLREEQQAERARQQAAAKAERLAAQQAREQERQAAAQARERQQREAAERRDQQASEADRRRRAVERRAAEAEFRTEAVRAAVTAFERLLADRNRDLVAHSRGAEAIFNAHGPDAFVAAIQQALATSVYPQGLDGSCAARYIPESRELWVEYELPRQEVIPAVTGYRYVKTKDLIQAEPRKPAEVNKLYEKLIGRVALRTLAEAFDVAPATLVGGIVFNGYVSAKDRATGKPVRPLLLSVQAMRDAFAEIVLDEPELDPKACLRGYLNALISPHPWDLVPVEPVLKFDLSKYKFVEEMDVIAGLDGGPVWYGGGKLAADLSWPKLRQRWSPPRAMSGAHLSAEERNAVWDHATRAAADAAAQIRATVWTDPAAAADAAWATSDTLHVAAAVLGSRILRQAADAYDRAARTPYGRIPPPSLAGNQLRQAARLLSAFAYLTGDRSMAPIVLITRLAALAEAVAELRDAQQHAAQAAAARAAAEQLHAAKYPASPAQPRPAQRASTAAQLAGLSFPPSPRPATPGQPGPAPGGPPPARRAPPPPRPRGPTR